MEHLVGATERAGPILMASWNAITPPNGSTLVSALRKKIFVQVTDAVAVTMPRSLPRSMRPNLNFPE